MNKNNYIHILSIKFLLIIFLALNSACDKEVSRTPVAPPPPEGFIYVNSTPEGYAIYKNGRNTGSFTPDSLTFLEPGQYEITLKKLYWRDTTVVVDVTMDKLAVVDVDFLANPSMYGDLILISVPAGAQVILTDSLRNETTPATLKSLLPGSYNVSFFLENFRSEKLDVIVESGKQNQYSTALRDTSVWVDFQVFNSQIQSSLLKSITVDNTGIIWIGSLDIGLIRFDQIDFTNFNESNSPLPDNKINYLAVDNQNRVWAGTDFGIAVFDGVSWIIYDRDNSGLTSEVINSIDFDETGIAWIGTTAGLVKFDGVNWQVFNDAQSRVWAMGSKLDNSGVVWIGTREKGIVALENNLLTFYPDSIFNYPTARISSVAKDQSGNIWFSHQPASGLRSGVSFWDGNLFSSTFLGTANNNVNHIFTDDENNKWVSTWEGFVWFDAQNSFQIFSSFNSLISSDKVNSSVRDQNGVVWLTTQGGGLNKFKVNNLK